ncbi:MAG: hypothetical protein AMXMBFR64_62300 [Myxococcales bacterium]
MGQLRDNLRALPRNLARSFLRDGLPGTDKERMRFVLSSLVLHIHPARVHPHTLRWWYTLGLGLLSFFLLVLLTISGVILMIYYVPSVAEAYPRMQDLASVVPGGRVLRNLHRWTAHAMVVAVMLHMARVFYTGAYKPPREANWLAGVGLLVLTFALAFTGYLLPWDQLGYWAAVIGANIAGSPTEVTEALGVTGDPGGAVRGLLLGGRDLGADALNRFYMLHCVVLPALIAALVGFHFFRVRKDGGLSRPGKD